MLTLAPRRACGSRTPPGGRGPQRRSTASAIDAGQPHPFTARATSAGPASGCRSRPDRHRAADRGPPDDVSALGGRASPVNEAVRAHRRGARGSGDHRPGACRTATPAAGPPSAGRRPPAHEGTPGRRDEPRGPGAPAARRAGHRPSVGTGQGPPALQPCRWSSPADCAGPGQHSKAAVARIHRAGEAGRQRGPLARVATPGSPWWVAPLPANESRCRDAADRGR